MDSIEQIPAIVILCTLPLPEVKDFAEFSTEVAECLNLVSDEVCKELENNYAMPYTSVLFNRKDYVGYDCVGRIRDLIILQEG